MTTVITSVTSTAGTNIDLTAGEDLYVAPSALVASQTVYGILADEGGHAIDIYGAVYGEDAGIRLDNLASSFGNSRVLVAVGASVSGRVVGIESLASSHSISVAGIVSGNNGFTHSGGTFGLNNSGSIIGSFGDGVRVNSAFGTIVNTGYIASTFSGSGVVLDNTTSIGSTTPTLTNFGTISGPSTAILGDSSNSDTVLNYGDVHGDISVSGEDDFVLNAGRVAGEIRLGSGNDTYDGRGGTVSEQVEGGAGDDTFYTDQEGIEIDGGADTDTVYALASVVSLGGLENILLRGGGDINATGDSGANTIRGTLGDNLILAGSGADVALGLGGDDEIFGEGGADVLRGGAGNDELDGGGGQDKLYGGAGNDIVFGQANDDLLVGGPGDDVIIGGAGRDTKIGGTGADTFVYTDVSESTLAAPDVIRDFERGVDVVQLTDINGNEAFNFIGTAAFSASGDAELRYSVNANGTAFVYMDVDGDGAADGQIRMLETAMLDANDFLL